MMATYCLILISAILKFAFSQSPCGENEIVTEAGNPCNSCEVRGFCPQYTGLGCDCFPGFFRNSFGLCVPPESCDAYGPPNVLPPSYEPIEPYTRPASQRCRNRYESYSSCGTACPATCDNPYPGPCIQQCVPGCFCNPGYVRNRQGACVRREQCEPQQPKCPRNYEIFSTCGSACPPTCDNQDPRCTKQCVPGCVCFPGYVRNREGICIRRDQCDTTTYIIPPQKCGPYEEFKSCGTACPATCLQPQPGYCSQQCVSGCFCVHGYVRKGKRCVRLEECEARPQPLPPALPPVRPQPPLMPPRLPPTPPPERPDFFDAPRSSPKNIPPTPPTVSGRTQQSLPIPPSVQPRQPSPPVELDSQGRGSNGCPVRERCNQYCIRNRFVAGFCTGPRFRTCSCHR